MSGSKPSVRTNVIADSAHGVDAACCVCRPCSLTHAHVSVDIFTVVRSAVQLLCARKNQWSSIHAHGHQMICISARTTVIIISWCILMTRKGQSGSKISCSRHVRQRWGQSGVDCDLWQGEHQRMNAWTAFSELRTLQDDLIYCKDNQWKCCLCVFALNKISSQTNYSPAAQPQTHNTDWENAATYSRKRPWGASIQREGDVITKEYSFLDCVRSPQATFANKCHPSIIMEEIRVSQSYCRMWILFQPL